MRHLMKKIRRLFFPAAVSLLLSFSSLAAEMPERQPADAAEISTLAEKAGSQPISAEKAAEDSENTSSETEKIITEPLRIDGQTLYEGMANTYEQGYVPLAENGIVHIVLPLIGQTYDGKVTVTADLGTADGSPFVYGNYSQTVGQAGGVYLFRLDVPLGKGRVNGSYPVTLRANYLDNTGSPAQQDFIVYATVTDGSAPANANARQTVEVPKLYISSCVIEPSTVEAEQTFTVRAAVENIGAIRARSILLSYGSEAAGLVPAQTDSVLHLENIAAGKSAETSFSLRATAEALAGSQPFFIKLDYMDLYGGTYSDSFTFLVHVTQPPEMGYDPLLIPDQISSGETFSFPVNVFNPGKSILHNVSAVLNASGLIPTASVFLGNILPGESADGEMKVYADTLPSDGGNGGGYGKTNGTVTISFEDDLGETHETGIPFSLQIAASADQEQAELEQQKTASQWWISVLVTFAAIAIIISAMVVTKFSREMQMR